jgi:hypothetical protein
MCGCGWVGGWVYKIEKFRTLSAQSENASLREANSSSAAFEKNPKIKDSFENQLIRFNYQKANIKKLGKPVIALCDHKMILKS